MNTIETQKQFSALDSLKGIVALAIAIYHVGGYFGCVYMNVLWPVYKFTRVFGNTFFFFVSGFLSAHASRKRILSESVDFKGYVLKKLDKLYPPLFISTILMLIFEILRNGRDFFDFYMLFRSLTVVSSGWIDIFEVYNYPMWFISVLLLCYVIYYFVSKQKSDGYYITVFLLFILGYYFQCNDFNIPFMFKRSGIGYFNFFAGVLTYELFKNIDRDKKHTALNICSFVCVFGFLALIAVKYYTGLDFIGETEAFVAVVFFPALFFISIFNKTFSRILCIKPLAALGRISMPVYYFHMPVVSAYIQTAYRVLTDGRNNINLILYLVLLFAFGWVYLKADRAVRKRVAGKKAVTEQ